MLGEIHCRAKLCLTAQRRLLDTHYTRQAPSPDMMLVVVCALERGGTTVGRHRLQVEATAHVPMAALSTHYCTENMYVMYPASSSERVLLLGSTAVVVLQQRAPSRW